MFVGTAYIDYQPDIDEDDLWIEDVTKDETRWTKNLQLSNIQDYNRDRQPPYKKEVHVFCFISNQGQALELMLLKKMIKIRTDVA